jgi:hypothetical protein
MTDTETVDESMVEKVRKLVAKADRTDSPEEAAAFFAKATELMQRFAISEAMLRDAKKSEQDEIVHLRIDFGSTYWQAFRSVAADLGRAFGFKVLIMESRKNGYAHWYGWKSEMGAAEVMWASLLIQAQRSANEHMKQSTEDDREVRFKEKRSFMLGFGTTVANRVNQQRAETRRQVSREQGESDGSLLPVLVSRDDLLTDFFNGLSTRSVRLKTGQVHSGGYTGGRRAGERADIGNPGLKNRRGLGSG